MEIFFVLLGKLIPLYVIIFVGFLASRKLQAEKKTLASILIYIASPVVVFDGIFKMDLSSGIFSLIPLYMVLAIIICFSFLWISKRLWSDSTPHIMGYAAANGNVGYFGLPVVVAIFGDQMLGVCAMIILAATLFGDTIGYYTIARGNYTMKAALKKAATIPTVYAFMLGILANYFAIPLGANYASFALNFRGVFVVLGMLIIGMGLADIKKYEWDFKFLAVPFVAKFLVWPILMALVVFFDASYFHFFSPLIHQVLVVFSLVPLGTNTVVYATQLKIYPEKIAAAVFLSTLFALAYIPLVVSLFLKR